MNNINAKTVRGHHQHTKTRRNMVIQGSIENFSRKRICELKRRGRTHGAGRKDIIKKGRMNGIDYAHWTTAPRTPPPNKGHLRATWKSNYLFLQIPVRSVFPSSGGLLHWTEVCWRDNIGGSMRTINFLAEDEVVERNDRKEYREVSGGHLGGNLNFDH